jgi:hypothetical protein
MDGIPRCGKRPTNFWQVGHVNVDHYAFELSPDTPTGSHALVAGMYHTETGERLQIADAEGAPLGTTVNLGSIEVIASEGV